MAMITITAATTLAASVAFTLAGPCRLRADDLDYGEFVDVYEARVDGDYEKAKVVGKGPMVKLTKGDNSVIFEGYGSYKCVVSHAGLVVGYDEG